MNTADLWSVLALVISLLAAILAWRVSNRQTLMQKEQNRLQTRMLDLEEARERDRLAEGTRANVVAEMVRSRETGRLYVTNAGPAVARNVRTLLDDTPLDQHPYIHEGVDSIGVLGPSARSEFIVTTWDGIKSRYHVRVTWDNPSGEIGTWESDLEFII